MNWQGRYDLAYLNRDGKVHNMLIRFNGETCCRTVEVAQVAEISENSFLRWVRRVFIISLRI